MGAESQQLYCRVSTLACRLFSVSTRPKHEDVVKKNAMQRYKIYNQAGQKKEKKEKVDIFSCVAS